jgi:hypothetical protein
VARANTPHHTIKLAKTNEWAGLGKCEKETKQNTVLVLDCAALLMFILLVSSLITAVRKSRRTFKLL